MKVAATATALLLALVMGFLYWGSYLLTATHSETGALGQLLDSAWFIWLLTFVGVAILAAGAIAAMALRRH